MKNIKPKNKPAASADDFFQKIFPSITGWVQDGWIEIGHSRWGDTFIKVLDEGGLVWEGKRTYQSLDDALLAAECAIVAIVGAKS